MAAQQSTAIGPPGKMRSEPSRNVLLIVSKHDIGPLVFSSEPAAVRGPISVPYEGPLRIDVLGIHARQQDNALSPHRTAKTDGA